MPDEDDENQEPEGISLSRDDLRQLREKARAADDYQAKLVELERKVLFNEAGLNLADKGAQYFMKGYEGDLTVEAIKAEAEEVGLFRKEEPKSQVPQQEMQQHQQMNRTTAGGGDPSTEDYAALIAAASSAEEVMQIATRFNVPTAYNRPE